jgi:predicted ATPase
MGRASYVEAARFLSKSVALVKALPDTPARARQELALQMARGRALQFTKGYAAPEVEAAYHRARELAQHGQEPLHLLSVLEGLVSFYLLRSELRTARELGKHMLSLAQRVHDPVWLGNSHIMLGNVLFACGVLDAARMHLEQGLACPTLQQPHPQSLPTPSRLQVFGLSRLALVLWHLGYPDQALQRSQTALTLARTLARSVILVSALIYAAHLHWRRQEAHRTGEYAEAAMLRDWARVAQGQGAAGITQLRQGLAAYRATGAEITVGYLVLLVEALRKGGQSEEGLRVIGEALAIGDSRGEGQWAAELSRCKGELLLTCSAADQTEAETCFQQALDMTRLQQARSWELRAAMSLSRLWQPQGKQREAQQLLAGVYGWFTEGFVTTDLQEARALLDALAS